MVSKQQKKKRNSKDPTSLKQNYKQLAVFVGIFIALMVVGLVISVIMLSYACSHGTDCAKILDNLQRVANA